MERRDRDASPGSDAYIVALSQVLPDDWLLLDWGTDDG